MAAAAAAGEDDDDGTFQQPMHFSLSVSDLVVGYNNFDIQNCPAKKRQASETHPQPSNTIQVETGSCCCCSWSWVFGLKYGWLVVFGGEKNELKIMVPSTCWLPPLPIPIVTCEKFGTNPLDGQKDMILGLKFEIA